MPPNYALSVKRPGEAIVRSKVYAWSSGTPQNIDLQDFLGSAPSPSPGGIWRICGLRARTTITATTAVGKTLRALQLWDVIDRISISDRFGPRIQLKGRELACISMFLEKAHPRTISQLDLIANTAGQTRTIYYTIPINNLFGMKSDSEAWWDYEDFAAGTWSITWASSTGLGDPTGNNAATITAASQQWFADLVEEPRNKLLVGERTMKARTRWGSTAISANQNSIALSTDAIIRYAFNDIGREGAVKATPDTWASQLLDSPTFNYSQVQDDSLTQQYLDRRQPENLFSGAAAADANPFVDGTCQMLFSPRVDGSALELPVGSNLAWRTTLTYGSGTFVAADNPSTVYAWIENRPPQQQDPAGETVLHPVGGPATSTTAMNPAIANTYGNKLEASVPISAVAGPSQPNRPSLASANGALGSGSGG